MYINLIITMLFLVSCTTYILKNKYKKEYNICINLLEFYFSNQTIKDSSIFYNIAIKDIATLGKKGATLND